jgi:hypothetical protein
MVAPVRESNASWRAVNLSPLLLDAMAWDRQGRPKALLASGEVLSAAAAWAAANPGELMGVDREFVAASQENERGLLRARRASRRNRMLVSAALLLAVLTLAGGSVAYSRSRETTKLRAANAEATRQQGLAESSAAEAKRQQGLAESSAAEAKRQQGVAESSAAEAKRQRALAESSAAEANRQRGLAESSAAEAKRQQRRAESSAAEAKRQQRRAESNAALAEASATEARKQKALADCYADRLVTAANDHYDQLRDAAFAGLQSLIAAPPAEQQGLAVDLLEQLQLIDGFVGRGGCPVG